MKEVIEQILKTEESARNRVEAAEAEAEDIVAKAKKEASVFIEEMTEKAADYAKRKKDEYEHQFLTEKDDILRQTKEQAVALRKKKEKNIDPIANSIFSQITSIQE